MKCGDFLPAYAAGGLIRRARATLHAARCARCAAVRERFVDAKREWGHPAAPSAFHQQVWQLATSAEPLPTPSKVLPPRKWAFATAACLLVICAVLALTRWPYLLTETNAPENPSQAKTMEPSSPQRMLNATQVDEIARALDQLADELNELAGLVSLIDARRDLDQLLTTYKPLDSSRQSQSEAN